MRRQNIALTVFLLGPLIVLALLCWLIAASVRDAAQHEAKRNATPRLSVDTAEPAP